MACDIEDTVTKAYHVVRVQRRPAVREAIASYIRFFTLTVEGREKTVTVVRSRRNTTVPTPSRSWLGVPTALATERFSITVGTAGENELWSVSAPVSIVLVFSEGSSIQNDVRDPVRHHDSKLPAFPQPILAQVRKVGGEKRDHFCRLWTWPRFSTGRMDRHGAFFEGLRRESTCPVVQCS